ncbi:hypothetical protein [Caulobacter sp. 17J80-11]|uniref:hypothetical protein n=1 Tax=Caulobacter sp. 17J80-11 TaxID=2763502 RepID=UPI001653EDF8|nr:hypothetical protein [Caulobacter sp. 17J80-11]MBC6983358.1 hypothetical protein [Caulobacter sp. 17J80-11]
MSRPRPTPLVAVLSEQVRAVGLSLRPGAALLAAVLALVTGVGASTALGAGQPLDFPDEARLLIGALGFLLPFAVWRGEKLFAGAWLWTLPVERRTHVLAKVAAGWVWLMLAVGLVVAWLAGLALGTGGELVATATGTIADAHGRITAVRWTEPAWGLAAPFTIATIGYLVVSALVVGLKRPLWWIAGGFLAACVLIEVLDADLPPARVLLAPFGFVLPNLAWWAAATAAWTSLGLLAVWLAASRHREG